MMKRYFSLCLALLMCAGLLCAVAPQSRADDSLVKKNGRGISSADELKVYDIVTFGVYPLWSYDDYADIEWIVLRKSGNRVTLLSRDVLDSRPYHEEDEQVNWLNCDLYVWLNDTFKITAFTEKEQNLINGSITIPTVAEARAMSKDMLSPEFTPFSVAMGADRGKGIWWVRDGDAFRTYKEEEIYCASVVQQGSVLEASYRVNLRGKGIRPMIQIDFDRQGVSSYDDAFWPAGATGPLMKGNRAVFSADDLRMYDDVTFGTYPQTAYDDASPIHWIVIGKNGDRVKLLSLLALDSQKYQEPYAAVSWRFCSLNAWLNDMFRDTAFSAEEQAVLGTDITLLSEAEAEKLPEEFRITRSTEYAILRGVDPTRCIWWLRDSSMVDAYENGHISSKQIYCASVVHPDGEIGSGYYRVDLGHKAVRPVVVIDFDLMAEQLS